MIGLVRFGRQSARVGRSALLASSVRHIHASSMMRGVDEFYDQVEGTVASSLMFFLFLSFFFFFAAWRLTRFG